MDIKGIAIGYGVLVVLTIAGMIGWDVYRYRAETANVPRQPPEINCACPPSCECCAGDGGECFCRQAVGILDAERKRHAVRIAELEFRTAVLETNAGICGE